MLRYIFFNSHCWPFHAAWQGETQLPKKIIPLEGTGAAWVIQALSAHQPLSGHEPFQTRNFHPSDGWKQQRQQRQHLHQDWVFWSRFKTWEKTIFWQSLSKSAERFLHHLISFHQLPRSRATTVSPWLSARRTLTFVWPPNASLPHVP